MPIELVEIDTGTLENGDQLRMRAKPDATARQLFLVAFEDNRVPPGAAQKLRREQSAERAADDQRSAHLCPSPKKVEGEECRDGHHGIAQANSSWPGL